MEHIRAFPQLLGAVERAAVTASIQPQQQASIPAPHTNLSMHWAATIKEDGSLSLRANWKA
jgi:hypothetical protein